MRLETQYMSFSINDYRSVKNEKRTKQEKNSALERRHSQLHAHITNVLANSRGRDTETTKYPAERMKIGWQMPHPGDCLQSAHGTDQTATVRSEFIAQ